MRDDLFTVVHETFFTDTCDYADIVLPADSTLERMDMLGGYGHFVYALSQPAIEKLGESVDNSELFRRLAVKMGYDDPCFSQTDEEMIRELIDPAFNPLFEGVTFDGLMENGLDARGRGFAAPAGPQQRSLAHAVGQDRDPQRGHGADRARSAAGVRAAHRRHGQSRRRPSAIRCR